jgi:hypothetical protein
VIDVQNQLFTRLSNSMIHLARPLSRWQDGGDRFAVLDVHSIVCETLHVCLFLCWL